ncbi:MAG TPA: hypothetical protein VGY30_06735 [Solirubrobacteraceae bacterium]|jgi:hypothetical protein|nr:hypothetical protein [Solirubrobacteraceae bacterium]
MPTAKTTSAKPRARTTAKRPATAPKRATGTISQSSTAERAVLIPVGAALIARERVLSGVSDAIANYNSTAKASAQLRKFERRGATARNRVERELRKTRVRVERELRERRREGEELANRVQERIQHLV